MLEHIEREKADKECKVVEEKHEVEGQEAKCKRRVVDKRKWRQLKRTMRTSSSRVLRLRTDRWIPNWEEGALRQISKVHKWYIT